MITNPSCPNCCDGSIELKVNGPVRPYQFSIDGGTTWVTADTWGGNTKVFNNLCEGTYDVRIDIDKDLNTQKCVYKETVILRSTNRTNCCPENKCDYCDNKDLVCCGPDTSLPVSNTWFQIFESVANITVQVVDNCCNILEEHKLSDPLPSWITDLVQNNTDIITTDIEVVLGNINYNCFRLRFILFELPNQVVYYTTPIYYKDDVTNVNCLGDGNDLVTICNNAIITVTRTDIPIIDSVDCFDFYYKNGSDFNNSFSLYGKLTPISIKTECVKISAPEGTPSFKEDYYKTVTKTTYNLQVCYLDYFYIRKFSSLLVNNELSINVCSEVKVLKLLNPIVNNLNDCTNDLWFFDLLFVEECYNGIDDCCEIPKDKIEFSIEVLPQDFSNVDDDLYLTLSDNGNGCNALLYYILIPISNASTVSSNLHYLQKLLNSLNTTPFASNTSAYIDGYTLYISVDRTDVNTLLGLVTASDEICFKSLQSCALVSTTLGSRVQPVVSVGQVRCCTRDNSVKPITITNVESTHNVNIQPCAPDINQVVNVQPCAPDLNITTNVEPCSPDIYNSVNVQPCSPDITTSINVEPCAPDINNYITTQACTPDIYQSVNVQPCNPEISTTIVTEPCSPDIYNSVTVEPCVTPINNYVTVEPCTTPIYNTINVQPCTPDIVTNTIVEPCSPDIYNNILVEPCTTPINQSINIQPCVTPINTNINVTPCAPDIYNTVNVQPCTPDITNINIVEPCSPNIYSNVSVQPCNPDIVQNINVSPCAPDITINNSVEPCSSDIYNHINVTPCTPDITTNINVEPCATDITNVTHVHPCVPDITQNINVSPCNPDITNNIIVEPCVVPVYNTINIEPCTPNVTNNINIEPCSSIINNNIVVQPCPIPVYNNINVQPCSSDIINNIVVEPCSSDVVNNITIEPCPTNVVNNITVEPCPSNTEVNNNITVLPCVPNVVQNINVEPCNTPIYNTVQVQPCNTPINNYVTVNPCTTPIINNITVLPCPAPVLLEPEIVVNVDPVINVEPCTPTVTINNTSTGFHPCAPTRLATSCCEDCPEDYLRLEVGLISANILELDLCDVNPDSVFGFALAGNVLVEATIPFIIKAQKIRDLLCEQCSSASGITFIEAFLYYLNNSAFISTGIFARLSLNPIFSYIYIYVPKSILPSPDAEPCNTIIGGTSSTFTTIENNPLFVLPEFSTDYVYCCPCSDCGGGGTPPANDCCCCPCNQSELLDYIIAFETYFAANAISLDLGTPKTVLEFITIVDSNLTNIFATISLETFESCYTLSYGVVNPTASVGGGSGSSGPFYTIDFAPKHLCLKGGGISFFVERQLANTIVTITMGYEHVSYGQIPGATAYFYPNTGVLTTYTFYKDYIRSPYNHFSVSGILRVNGASSANSGGSLGIYLEQPICE